MGYPLWVVTNRSSVLLEGRDWSRFGGVLVRCKGGRLKHVEFERKHQLIDLSLLEVMEVHSKCKNSRLLVCRFWFFSLICSWKVTMVHVARPLLRRSPSLCPSLDRLMCLGQVLFHPESFSEVDFVLQSKSFYFHGGRGQLCVSGPPNPWTTLVFLRTSVHRGRLRRVYIRVYTSSLPVHPCFFRTFDTSRRFTVV